MLRSALLCAAVSALLSVPLLAQRPADAKPWSFAPWRPSAPPESHDPEWSRNEIDRFVRAALADQGLTPNPRAPFDVLLRRAAYVLTGLPPTAEQVAKLRASPDETTFATLVEELLASPHYGERQARHWLDLARYSDSNGLDENLAFANAFRYRDWVVRAHNEDLPFDRFAQMQIAGDLMVDEEGVGIDGYVATGFLALGPRMLAEQDKEKLVLDTIDEQLDLLGRSFLGLTLGCARCHDHKFDPVSAADYYALAGVFRSAKSFHDTGHVSRWFDRELADDAAIADRKAKIAAAEAAKKAHAEAAETATAAQQATMVGDAGRYLLAGQALLAHAVYVEAEASPRTSLRTDHATYGTPEVGVLHTHQAGVQFAEWDLVVPHSGLWHLDARFAAQEVRPMRVLVDGVVVAERALDAVTGGWLPAHQDWRHVVDCRLESGRRTLRLEALGPNVPHLDALHLTPVDLGSAVAAETLAGLLPPAVRRSAAVLAGRGHHPLVALWSELAPLPTDTFAATAAAATGKGGLANVVLGALAPTDQRDLAARCQTLFAAAAAAAQEQRRAKPKEPVRLAGDALEQARALLFDRGGMLELPTEALRDYLPAATLAALEDLAQKRDAAVAAIPPAAPSAMAVGEGAVVDLPIHLRGNHLTLAETKIPRGVLGALVGLAPAPTMPEDRSGRRELARWMFDPNLPLAARVQANRIWQRAFGEGLSRSPSNFGNRGDVPVHLDLLDWLARDLAEHGWSQKRLWRTILLSQTWQQSAAHREDAYNQDPDNRYLWRAERRRLDAESVRDAMLAATGELDRTLGGSLLPTKDREYVTNDQSNDRASYDSLRRSLYLPIIRNAMFDMFTAFDYVDPSVHLECRPTSAVATQALLLLNGDFVLARSRALAGVTAGPTSASDEARIAELWRRALAREPADDERRRAAAWLQTARDAGRPEDAFAGLAQVLFASSEFLYVD